MTAALLLFLQLGAPAGMLTVKSADRESRLPIVAHQGSEAVRADLLALALDGKAERQSSSSGRWRLTLSGASFDVTDRVPFVQHGTETVPLAVAPYVSGGYLYLPLQLLADVLPRIATGLLYDAPSRELRRFNATATRAPPEPAAKAPAPVVRSVSAAPARQRIVVVDAGHGGPDRGMTGPIGSARKIREKDITLQVARRYAAELRERGYKVVMTRNKDTLIALSDRGRIANRNQGDLFVSIHVNAANPRWPNPGRARGFETFFLAEAKTEDAQRVADMENESVRFETEVETTSDDPLSFIVNDMAQNEHLRESNGAASAIQRHLARIHPGPNRGVKQAGFRVLVTAFMPAVLVEIGFGTNPAESRYLTTPAEQIRIADAMASATDEYFAGYDRRVGAGGS